MEHKNYNAIHKSVRKKDSMQLLLGKPVYTDDITGPALVVKLLRSPHANAIVEEIHTEIAKKIPGVDRICLVSRQQHITWARESR
jgi:CO/xanthine dehydrogenase Mo-binding subunit